MSPMNDFRRRPFLPGEPPTMTRSQSIAQAIEATIRARVKREKAEAEKQKVPPTTTGWFDAFAEAKERAAEREVIMANLERELAAINRELQERLRRRRVIARARAILKRR
jgi:hypothetical protein